MTQRTTIQETLHIVNRVILSRCCLFFIILGSANAGPFSGPDNRTMGVIPMGEKFNELLRAKERSGSGGTARTYYHPPLPSAFSLASEMPAAGDQGSQLSCVPWAAGYSAKSYQEGIEEGWDLRDLQHLYSPAYIYNQIAGNRGTDTGMYIPEALNIIQENGCATLAQFPYNPNDFRTQPSDSLKQLSGKYRIQKWEAISFTDRKELKSCLYNKTPVIVAIEPDSNFIRFRGNGTFSGFVPGKVLQLHAVCMVGYDDSRAAFQIMNSWGRGWGDGGFAWIDYDTFGQMCREAYVMYDAPNNSVPPPVPIPAPTPHPAPAPRPAPQPQPKPEPKPVPPQPSPDPKPSPTPPPRPAPNPKPYPSSPDDFIGYWVNPEPTTENIAALNIHRVGNEVKVDDYLFSNGHVTRNGTWPVYLNGTNLVFVLKFWFTARNVLLIKRSEDCVVVDVYDETSVVGSNWPAKQAASYEKIPVVGRLFERMGNLPDKFLMYKTNDLAPR